MSNFQQIANSKNLRITYLFIKTPLLTNTKITKFIGIQSFLRAIISFKTEDKEKARLVKLRETTATSISQELTHLSGNARNAQMFICQSCPE